VPLSTLNQKIKRLNIEVKRRRAGLSLPAVWRSSDPRFRLARCHSASRLTRRHTWQVRPPLLELENVVLAPHVGNASIETRRPPNLLNPEAIGK
jgi:hypothetical protein